MLCERKRWKMIQHGDADRELQAIGSLKARYFRWLDTKNWEAWRTVFAPDVVAVFANAVGPAESGEAQAGSSRWEGVDTLVDSISEVLKDFVTVHHGHTPELELVSPTAAVGIWAMADIVDFPGGQTLHGAGHYQETYEKVDGHWRIKTIHLTRTRMELQNARS